MTPNAANFTGAEELYVSIAERLARAVQSRHDAWHLMAVATVAADGSPRVRTVVLRRFDAAARVVHFHADARSPKVAEIRERPGVQLMLYDPVARLQARISATAAVHVGDDAARAGWDASQPMSRACYAATLGPSHELIEGQMVPVLLPGQFDEAEAFANFAVIACAVETIDVLELHADGHRRARLDWVGAWAMTRLTP